MAARRRSPDPGTTAADSAFGLRRSEQRGLRRLSLPRHAGRDRYREFVRALQEVRGG